MSWHCSRALVEEFSAACCVGSAPFAPLNSTITAVKCLSDGKTTESCVRSQSGMTCERLMEIPGAAEWMSSLEDSPVRTYQSPENAQESTENPAACGERWPESLAKYDRNTRSWKIRQLSLFEGSIEFSETWPRWGLMRDGELHRLKMPSGLEEFRRYITSVEESGLSRKLPTPVANMGERGGRGDLLGVIRGYKYTKRRHRSQAEKAPTPGACRAANDTKMTRSGDARKKQKTLGWWVAESLKVAPPISEQIGGQLNPSWVEWFMWWPIGWTGLEPLEMDKFRQWCSSHGIY